VRDVSPIIAYRGWMLQVSIIVELLRTWPRVIFWLAVLAQAALWFLVPALFYSAPPGELPFVLAIGHEFQLGTYLGPPLAFWLADVMFTLSGRSVIGIYLLAQVCVVVTYWAVFNLGRAIVGAQQAAMATLLMVGISVLSVPTPDFSPAILAMPLTALALLHFWYAIGEGKRNYWFTLAIEIGLLLLTSYAGLILVGLMALWLLMTKQGKAALATTDPWMAGIVVVLVLFPHLIWLDVADELVLPTLQRLHSAEAADTNLVAWLRLVVILLAFHIGLAVLVMLATVRRNTDQAAEFRRLPIDPFARNFVYTFALMPPFIATLIAAVVGLDTPLGGAQPLLVLSGLAVVVAAGDVIRFYRQPLVGLVWSALLVAPPLLTVIAVVLLPWIAAVDLAVVQPANAMGRFFAETFERRMGQPLSVVSGEPRLAALVALGTPARPSLYLFAASRRSTWVTPEDIAKRGAVVVWSASDTAGLPPPEIRQAFPDLVPEVPRAFERPIQGRLPLLRIGWGMIRPQNAPPEAK
jgi:dolichyl-phosphate-mannose-protein mannosyltransferase